MVCDYFAITGHTQIGNKSLILHAGIWRGLIKRNALRRSEHVLLTIHNLSGDLIDRKCYGVSRSQEPKCESLRSNDRVLFGLALLQRQNQSLVSP